MTQNHASRLIRAGILALITLLVVAMSQSRADVQITPDAPTAHAQTVNGYTITTTEPTPWLAFLLPSHGKPCNRPTETGTPRVGSDPDTNFQVLDAGGAIQQGRWLIWPDGIYQPVHISVLTPPLGGCFYAGAKAMGQTGIKKGAQIFNAQPLDGIATGGSIIEQDWYHHAFSVDWWITDNTSQPVTLQTERLGASSGFDVTASDDLGQPKVSRKGYRWTWHAPLQLAPGQTIHTIVQMSRPCGDYAANLRLHTEALGADGTDYITGIGNGLNVQLDRGC